MGVCGGLDPILELYRSQHLVSHLLGFLHTLQVRLVICVWICSTTD